MSHIPPANPVLDSYLISKTVCLENNYIAGYALIRKSQCEIVNFVSPTLRLLCFKEGACEWLVNGKICQFNAGDVVVFSNMCMRNIHRLLSEQIVYEMYDFYTNILNNRDLWRIFYSDQHVVATQAEPRFRRAFALLELLHDEMFSGDDTPHHVEYIKALINLLAIEFTRHLGNDAIDVPDSVFRISESMQYISTHLSEKLDLPGLAGLCGYTPEHYSRLFKKCLGVTPKQYIINARIANAVHLIQNDHYAVLDAAFSSGFQSSSAFYKSFKFYRGTTPHGFISKLVNEAGGGSNED